MTDPRGSFTVSAGGKDYRLWLGMSVLADLQDKHGQDVLQRIDPPADAGPNWMPPLRILIDLFLFALQRHHADEASEYLVDEILSENADAFQGLMGAAFPDQTEGKSGNAKRPKRAA